MSTAALNITDDPGSNQVASVVADVGGLATTDDPGSNALTSAVADAAALATNDQPDLIVAGSYAQPRVPRTVRDLLRRALRLAGALGVGDTDDADDFATALMAANQMLGTWSIDGLMVFTNTEVSFPMVPGRAQYSLGPFGDFDTLRPTEIRYAFLRDQYGLDRPLQIISRDVFSGIALKGLTQTYPVAMALDDGFPRSNLMFYPAPFDGLRLFLGIVQPLLGWVDINATVDLPPGYEEAIVMSVAEIIAPEYDRQVSPMVSIRAQTARGRIRSANLPEPPSRALDWTGGSSASGNGLAAFLSGY